MEDSVFFNQRTRVYYTEYSLFAPLDIFYSSPPSSVYKGLTSGASISVLVEVSGWRERLGVHSLCFLPFSLQSNSNHVFFPDYSFCLSLTPRKQPSLSCSKCPSLALSSLGVGECSPLLLCRSGFLIFSLIC